MFRRCPSKISSSKWTLGFAGFFAFGALACDGPADDLREWRPSDHDRAEDAPQATAAPESEKSGAAKTFQRHGVTDVALVTWRQQCVRCHGIIGRADGPEASATGARDLSDPAWQKAASDERIASSIKGGKGAMPAQPLPDSTITALVQLVRLLDRSRVASEAPENTDAGTANTKAPSGSARAPSPSASIQAAPSVAASAP